MTVAMLYTPLVDRERRRLLNSHLAPSSVIVLVATLSPPSGASPGGHRRFGPRQDHLPPIATSHQQGPGSQRGQRDGAQPPSVALATSAIGRFQEVVPVQRPYGRRGHWKGRR